MDRNSVDRIRGILGLAGRDTTLPLIVANLESKKRERETNRVRKMVATKRAKKERAQKQQLNKFRTRNKGIAGEWRATLAKWKAGGPMAERYRPLQEVIEARRALCERFKVNQWLGVKELNLEAPGTRRYYRTDVLWLERQGFIELRLLDGRGDKSLPPVHRRINGRRQWRRTDKAYYDYEPQGGQAAIYRWQSLSGNDQPKDLERKQGGGTKHNPGK